MERIVRRLPAGDPKQYCAFIDMESVFPDAGFESRLYDTLEMLIFEGYTHFICDASGEPGLRTAAMVASLTKVYPEITMELAFPCDIRQSSCPAPLLDLIYRADVVTFAGSSMDMEALRKLKNYLVCQGNLLLAMCDGETGRVAPVVEQARLAGRQITCIPNRIGCRIALVG